jgi:hypothetical protein
MRSHHNHDPHNPSPITRRQLLTAGAVTGLPLLFWLRTGNPSGPVAAPSTTVATPPSLEPEPPPTTTVAVSEVEPVVVPELDHDLARGMSEPVVEVLQDRLHELGFDPGPVDGFFGEATLRSVWAFEKLVLGVPRVEATGIVTPAFWRDIHEPSGITPRRTPGGAHLEVYLPEQVAVLFVDGSVRVVTHVSSGQGIEWCDEVTVDNDDGTQETIGICGLSITPGGVYHFERMVEGWRNAKLGRLYKPVYFNFGIAIHGASNVPDYPASRGCVRFPMHIADYMQDLVSIGDAVYVFDGVEDPEHYGAQPMRFDWPDPDYTMTTSSTTTTTSTTTTPTPAPVATTTPSPAPPPTTPPPTMPPTTVPPSTVPPSTVPPTTVG